MGASDLSIWARLAGQIADLGMDALGAKRCATKGHRWRDVKMVVLRKDGNLDEYERGTAQRCVRCGEERQKIAP